MIDFHTHILPGIDDGSRSSNMTREMLHIEIEQGVHHIIATPHFYASESSIQHFISRRDQAMSRVREKVLEPSEMKMPRISLGAEVYYFPGMGKAELQDLCIQGTDLILLEMPFAQWTEDIYKDVKDILRKQGLSIILAHIERYYPYQKNKTIWQKVFELPVIAQFNTGCLLKLTRRKLALQYLKDGYPSLLGSDCHNTSTRRPNLAEGRAVIRRKVGDGKIEDIDLFGERLLRDHTV